MFYSLTRKFMVIIVDSLQFSRTCTPTSLNKLIILKVQGQAHWGTYLQSVIIFIRISPLCRTDYGENPMKKSQAETILSVPMNKETVNKFVYVRAL